MRLLWMKSSGLRFSLPFSPSVRDWALSDEGRGQPPEQSPYLFRKYARAGSSDGGIRGSGLGLAICKGLVEAPGGRIRAESGGTGLGTRFTFTISVAEETGSPATASSSSNSAATACWISRCAPSRNSSVSGPVIPSRFSGSIT